MMWRTRFSRVVERWIDHEPAPWPPPHLLREHVTNALGLAKAKRSSHARFTANPRDTLWVEGTLAMAIAGRGELLRGGINPLRSVANAIQFAGCKLGRFSGSCEVLPGES